MYSLHQLHSTKGQHHEQSCFSYQIIKLNTFLGMIQLQGLLCGIRPDFDHLPSLFRQ